METLQLLAVALGLASLAGLNLYLTVFVTGLSIQQHWIVLAPQYQQLEVLAHPAVIVISGVLYFLQFFADKVPWVDSLWDSIHTVIRPIGGALLAVRVLGSTNPVFDVVIALLAGSIALTVHGMKAGTRLVANTSPEPFSNIALSLTEDVTVLGGLALLHFNPILALVVLVLFLAAIAYFAPKLVRGTKVILWLVWKKLNAPAAEEAAQELPDKLPADFDILFSRLNLLGEKVLWAVPCISGSSKLFPANLFGYLIATAEEPKKLCFVARFGWSKVSETLELENYKVSREPRFLSENLVLYSLEKKPRFVFLFDRSVAARVKAVTSSLEQRLGEREPELLART